MNSPNAKKPNRGVGHRSAAIFIRVPQSVKESLERIAKEQKRSLSSQAFVLLEEAVKGYDEV